MKQKLYQTPDMSVIQVQVEGTVLTASTAHEDYDLGNVYEGIFEDE